MNHPQADFTVDSTVKCVECSPRVECRVYSTLKSDYRVCRTETHESSSRGLYCRQYIEMCRVKYSCLYENSFRIHTIILYTEAIITVSMSCFYKKRLFKGIGRIRGGLGPPYWPGGTVKTQTKREMEQNVNIFESFS